MVEMLLARTAAEAEEVERIRSLHPVTRHMHQQLSRHCTPVTTLSFLPSSQQLDDEYMAIVHLFHAILAIWNSFDFSKKGSRSYLYRLAAGKVLNRLKQDIKWY